MQSSSDSLDGVRELYCRIEVLPKKANLYFCCKGHGVLLGKAFGISKSTVHKDVTSRLMQVNPTLAKQTRAVLDINKSERHIRGGLATREKYLHKSDTAG